MNPAFMAHVEKTETCWLWTGRLWNGYGRFGGTGAHRVSYIAVKGPIPEGLELDHLCRVRNCVNPDHLEAVDHWTNCARGISPAADNICKETCPRGHEYDRFKGPGRGKGRRCVTCDREYARGMWQRRGDVVKARRRELTMTVAERVKRFCGDCGAFVNPRRKLYQRDGREVCYACRDLSTFTCTCGRTVRGNGGMSIHRKACDGQYLGVRLDAAQQEPATP